MGNVFRRPGRVPYSFYTFRTVHQDMRCSRTARRARRQTSRHPARKASVQLRLPLQESTIQKTSMILYTRPHRSSPKHHLRPVAPIPNVERKGQERPALCISTWCFCVLCSNLHACSNTRPPPLLYHRAALAAGFAAAGSTGKSFFLFNSTISPSGSRSATATRPLFPASAGLARGPALGAVLSTLAMQVATYCLAPSAF